MAVFNPVADRRIACGRGSPGVRRRSAGNAIALKMCKCGLDIFFFDNVELDMLFESPLPGCEVSWECGMDQQETLLQCRPMIRNSGVFAMRPPQAVAVRSGLFPNSCVKVFVPRYSSLGIEAESWASSIPANTSQVVEVGGVSFTAWYFHR